MSVAKITETYLDDIADAIRFKLMSSSATYTPPQMASAIMSIAGGPNAVYVTDTVDPETGGIIRTINGTDISNDTVVADALLSGFTAHTSSGVAIVGTHSCSGGGGTDTSDATLTSGDQILYSYTAYAKGIKFTGTIQTKSATDVTVAGSSITTPSGYFSQAVTKNVSAGSATTPATTVTVTPGITVNSTGLITATAGGTSNVTPTVSAGYVTAGTAGTITVSGTKTSQLTSKGTGTYYPSTADQTIASQQWLVSAQTLKSVTYTGLTAGNIVSGVTVKIGDTGNASRIAQVTGTATIGTDTTDATLTSGGQMLSSYTAYAKGTKYTGTIPTKTSTDLTASGLVVTVPSGYYSQATTKEVSLTTGTLTSSIADDVQMMSMYAYTNSSAYFSSAKVVYFPQMTVSSATTVTVNSGGDVTTTFSPSTAGAAFTKATYTVTKSSALHVMSSEDYAFQFNGVDANNFPLITVDANNEGYQFERTFTMTGDVSISTQGASTYYVSTADRTITSSKWLTGAQTIKSVTTTNLSASYILSGITVKVGDSGNASRIAQVSGTLTVYTYYSSTSAPTAGIGNDGDIFLQIDDTV